MEKQVPLLIGGGLEQEFNLSVKVRKKDLLEESKLIIKPPNDVTFNQSFHRSQQHTGYRSQHRKTIEIGQLQINSPSEYRLVFKAPEITDKTVQNTQSQINYFLVRDDHSNYKSHRRNRNFVTIMKGNISNERFNASQVSIREAFDTLNQDSSKKTTLPELRTRFESHARLGRHQKTEMKEVSSKGLNKSVLNTSTINLDTIHRIEQYHKLKKIVQSKEVTLERGQAKVFGFNPNSSTTQSKTGRNNQLNSELFKNSIGRILDKDHTYQQLLNAHQSTSASKANQGLQDSATFNQASQSPSNLHSATKLKYQFAKAEGKKVNSMDFFSKSLEKSQQQHLSSINIRRKETMDRIKKNNCDLIKKQFKTKPLECEPKLHSHRKICNQSGVAYLRNENSTRFKTGPFTRNLIRKTFTKEQGKGNSIKSKDNSPKRKREISMDSIQQFELKEDDNQDTQRLKNNSSFTKSIQHFKEEKRKQLEDLSFQFMSHAPRPKKRINFEQEQKLQHIQRLMDFEREDEVRNEGEEERKEEPNLWMERLDSKEYTHKSEESEDEEEEKRSSQLERLAKSVFERANFFSIMKNSHNNPFVEQLKEQRTQANFVNSCLSEKQNPLPIMQKISPEGHLQLNSGYVFSMGLAKALGKALSENSGHLRRLTLVNNNLADGMLFQILDGLCGRDDIQSIQIQKNEVGEKTCQALKNNLQSHQNSKCLKEIMIEDCLNYPNSIVSLLEEIFKTGYLEKLSLNGILKDSIQLEWICRIISHLPALKDLSLANNKLTNYQLMKLFESLKGNKTLRSLDLSWNQINTTISKSHFQYFMDFIFQNKNLIHLNLSKTELRGEQFNQVILYIKRSQSLLSIHLSGNKVDKTCKYFLYHKLKARKCFSKKGICKEFGNYFQDLHKNCSPKAKQIYDSLDLKELKDLQRSQKVGKIKDYHDKQLIISRINGHSEIKGSNFWSITDECFICDKWRYTIVLWNKNLDQRFSIVPKHNSQIEELINHVNLENYRYNEIKEQVDRSAFIFGTLTQWKAKRMLKLSEFCAILEKIPQSDLEKEGFRSQYQAKCMVHWEDIFKKFLPYEDHKVVNYSRKEQFQSQSDPYFVYVDFVRPGKHYYFVQYIESGQTQEQFSFHQYIAKPRIEDIKISLKAYNRLNIQRKFEKQLSVFKDWREDKLHLLQKGCKEELKYWKIPKFVKDQKEQQELIKEILDNVSVLKTLFTILSSASNYPMLTWIDFSTFIFNFKIVGQNLSISTIDRIFIATKVVAEGYQDGQERDMFRYEFYESLVRIAGAKYKDNGLATSYINSLRLLLSQSILPNANLFSWQSWREQRLWTLEVNDIFEANFESVRRLYRHYFTPKKKYFDLQDALCMFTREVQLGLQDKEVVQCFGLCKMTLYQEMGQRDKYYRLEFPEFIEFIARIADVKFGESSRLTLGQKLESVLDDVFTVIGQKRNEVRIEDEYVSQSEEEFNEDLVLL